MKTKLFLLAFCLLITTTATAQNLTATEIVKRADDNRRGKSSFSEVTMTIVRPNWTREIGIKSWSMGTEFSLTLITSPARDAGQTFLKRGRDLWNWQPSINRMIRMSSSVMGQSWMGSDFTNDDMVRESSIVNDYTHKLLGRERVREFDCFKIELTPKEDSPVVWGKVITWICATNFVEIKSEFYDEDNFLVNTFNSFDIKSFGRRRMATRMEVVPAERPRQKTVLTINRQEFDIDINEDFFSQQNMRRVR